MRVETIIVACLAVCSSVQAELRPHASDSFEIAGADKVFVKADVELKGAALLLWNDAVKKSAFVRYAFSPNPDMVLFNKEGLPASPFTTEN